MPGPTFNPVPSSIQISRILNRRIPQVKPMLPRMPVRLPRQTGGAIPDDPAEPFAGPIVHPDGGRTDSVPMHVPTGSYVLPADMVSHIGEGNSLAGLKILRMMFGPWPYMGVSGPYGSDLGKGVRGKGPPPQKKPSIVNMPTFQVGPGVAQNVERPQRFGGQVNQPTGNGSVPIMASGGEFVIRPEEVARAGNGDLDRGHRVLDRWVKGMRAKHIKTLQRLPGPAK